MAQSSVCYSPQNSLFGNTEKLANAALTEGNNTPAMSHTPTLAHAVAPLLGFALSSMAKYLKNNLKQTFKTVLDLRVSPVLAPAPVIVLFYDDLCEKLLKARFPDVYRNKTYMKCYNFF